MNIIIYYKLHFKECIETITEMVWKSFNQVKLFPSSISRWSWGQFLSIFPKLCAVFDGRLWAREFSLIEKMIKKLFLISRVWYTTCWCSFCCKSISLGTDNDYLRNPPTILYPIISISSLWNKTLDGWKNRGVSSTAIGVKCS